MIKESKTLIIALIPLIIGVSIGFILIFNEEGGIMTTGGIVALAVALLSVAGSIFCVFLNFRKDSNRISEVKADTSEIKPKVNGIIEYAKETNQSILRVIEPGINQIDGMHTDVSTILEDVNYRKRLQTEYRGTTTYDQMAAGLHSVYEDNASLQRTQMELKSQVRKLTLENSELKKKNRSLEKEKDELKIELSQRLRERTHDKGIER